MAVVVVVVSCGRTGRVRLLDEVVFDLVGLLHAHVGDGELTRVPLRKPEADAPISQQVVHVHLL
jgi:hypothetical protein